MSKRHLPLEPRPAELNRKLAVLEVLVGEVRKEYAWTHGWANNPSRHGDSLEAHVSYGGVNDQIGSLVVSGDKEAARRALSRVAKDVDECLKIMASAQHQLKDSIRQRDPMPTQPGPAFISRQDKREGYAAQGRREARGEGQAQ